MVTLKSKSLLRAGLLLTLGLITVNVHAENMPSLWGEPAEPPPNSLKVPDSLTQKGGFEYVPLSPIFFDYNQAPLTVEGQQSLDAAVEYLLNQNNIKRILIEGNADQDGAKNYNYKLSDKRTEIVRNYLILKGIKPNMMATIGRGEQTPVDQHWTRDGRRRNRHTMIYVVQWLNE